jgi:hypothetical protein
MIWKLLLLALLLLAWRDARRRRLILETTWCNVVFPEGRQRVYLVLLMWRRPWRVAVLETMLTPARRWESWWMPSVGVWWTCRCGRLRWQIRLQ